MTSFGFDLYIFGTVKSEAAMPGALYLLQNFVNEVNSKNLLITLTFSKVKKTR